MSKSKKNLLKAVKILLNNSFTFFSGSNKEKSYNIRACLENSRLQTNEKFDEKFGFLNIPVKIELAKRLRQNSDVEPIPAKLLRKYIMYAKSTIEPIIGKGIKKI
jgi:DNA replicative helicase MCM subunit Mcm2 (Cdc46/Mcm family)